MMKVTLNKRKVVIVGGGITGLTTAFYLQQYAKKQSLPLDIKLIESSLRVGGKIHTHRKNGFIIERGPESFFDTCSSVRKLAKELNIEHELVQNNDGRTYIAVGNDLHPIPSNLLFGGSPAVSSFMTSSVFSLSGKVRAAGDLFLPRAKQEIDEPISDFFKRRFGPEVVENLVEPVLAGTFAGDVDHLSMKSMFPQVYQLEQEYRSLIVGMKKTGKGIYAIDDHPGELHYETFRNGLETLIEALEQQLEPGTILKAMKVESVEQLANGQVIIYTNNSEALKADHVIMTTPFNVVKNVFQDSEAIRTLPKMNYATIATVTMAFEKGQIDKYKDANNFFVSRNSDLAITTCTWSNHKWNDVAPDDCDLLRVYIGRVGDESIVELSDSEIEKIVMQDLKRAIKLKNEPFYTVVTRWKESMPQYTIGHEERMKVLQEQFLKEYPQVQLVGSSYRGISVPNCVAQGQEAAMQAIQFFSESVIS
ncbi:MAG: protoporphyrinogen oxidase [Solibacillus sp.]